MKKQGNISINEVIKKCEEYIIKKEFKSYDLFDAMTNDYINRATKNKKLLRRVIIQLARRSPFDLHWLGMKKLFHTNVPKIQTETTANFRRKTFICLKSFQQK